MLKKPLTKLLTKLMLVLVTVFSFSSIHFAQYQILPANHIVFAELGGSNVFGTSLNYEQTLIRTHWACFNARIGIGYSNSFNYYFDRNMSFPFSGSILWGGYKHHFETGVGITPVLLFRKDAFQYEFAKQLIIGYHYMQPEGGLMFRLSFTPLVLTDTLKGTIVKNKIPWLGLGLGYGF